MKRSLKRPFITRRRVRFWHRILAFSAGLVIAVSGLSGSLLVYGPEIDRALNPDLRRVAVGTFRQPLDENLDIVRKAYPGESIRFTRLPRRPEDSLEVWVGASSLRRIYLDPYTGRIIGIRGEHEGLTGFLHNLHVYLLGGKTGKNILGALGLAFLVLLGTGLILWWPRGGGWRGAFRLGWNDTGIKKLYNKHRFAGITSLGFLMVSTLTGLGMIYHERSDAMLGAILGGPMRVPITKLYAPWKQPPLSLDQLIDHAQNVLPGAVPTWITPPVSNTAPLILRMRFPESPHPKGLTFIALHPEDGRPIVVYNSRKVGFGQRVSDLKYPLHIGRVWGEFGRIFVVFLGLMPAFLLASGSLFLKGRKPDHSLFSASLTGK